MKNVLGNSVHVERGLLIFRWREMARRSSFWNATISNKDNENVVPGMDK